MVVAEQVFKWNPVGQGQGRLVVHETAIKLYLPFLGYTFLDNYKQIASLILKNIYFFLNRKEKIKSTYVFFSLRQYFVII